MLALLIMCKHVATCDIKFKESKGCGSDFASGDMITFCFVLLIPLAFLSYHNNAYISNLFPNISYMLW